MSNHPSEITLLDYLEGRLTGKNMIYLVDGKVKGWKGSVSLEFSGKLEIVFVDDVKRAIKFTFSR